MQVKTYVDVDIVAVEQDARLAAKYARMDQARKSRKRGRPDLGM